MDPPQAGVVLLISDKIDFKPKLVRGDEEGHFTLIKGTICQEDIRIVEYNIYVPSVSAPNLTKQTL
jgi:hypothetical protein